MSAVDDILNYIQLTPRVATSGQPRPAQFEAMAEAGYQVVINLAMPDSDHAVADEGRLVTAAGMTYVHIPVPFEAPTIEHLREFCRVMVAYQEARVWVHCVVNARVSAFMYQYLSKVEHLPEAECRSPILDQWLPQMDEVWKQFLDLGARELFS